MAARKPAEHPAAPAAGEARKRTTRSTITTEELPDETARDAPVEAWLADMAGDASIAYVRVWRRHGGRWAWLGKRNDILPPFDFDVDALFQTYGDGEYRLVPYDTSNRVRGGRNEIVQAGYVGRIRANADGTTSQASPPGEEQLDAADMTDLIKMARQRMILRSLQDAGGERDPAPVYDRGPDELERLSQLATVFATLQPKPMDLAALIAAAGTFLTPILGRLLAPPEPADKVLGLFEKWMDIRERMDGGEGTDWKTALVRGLAALAENPAIRQALTGAVPRPVLPPTPPPAQLPTGHGAAVFADPHPPATAPSVANGHPGDAGPPMSAEEQQSRHVLSTMVWPLVKRAGLASVDDFETYAALIDQQLPGFLDQWGSAEPNQAMVVLGSLDRDVLTNIELQRWLLAFHAFVRTDFLQRDDAETDQGGAAAHE